MLYKKPVFELLCFSFLYLHTCHMWFTFYPTEELFEKQLSSSREESVSLSEECVDFGFVFVSVFLFHRMWYS